MLELSLTNLVNILLLETDIYHFISPHIFLIIPFQVLAM